MSVIADPSISVYITSFNQKNYLVEAIESVLAQTLSPYEIVVIDDCSTDGSQELISGFKSTYPNLIKPIFHLQNYGIGKTRTEALQALTGDYVTYLDGDDRFLPKKLEKEVILLQNNDDIHVAYSNYYYIDAEGKRTGIWAQNAVPPQGDVFLQVFARDFPRGRIFRNELISSSCLNEIDLYDFSLLTHEDWDFKIRLTNMFKTVYCPDPLMEYRHHPLGLSRLPARLRLKSMKRVYEKNYHLIEIASENERLRLRKNLYSKFAHLALKSVKEEGMEGNLRLALQYLQTFFLDYFRTFDKIF